MEPSYGLACFNITRIMVVPWARNLCQDKKLSVTKRVGMPAELLHATDLMQWASDSLN